MQKQQMDRVISSEEGSVQGYRVLYEQLPANWSACTPDLPVILVTGESREECERLMAEAIPLHLEGLREDRAERPWLYTHEQLSPELRAVFARIDAA
ncbi:MAG TPA: type II toxin-antitoxin system HicB family antitoxin [Chloroflexota bacterium]|nr:type II toxin-antitoxin system HicB family antitoxin [Chloroflexota bacterium]